MSADTIPDIALKPARKVWKSALFIAGSVALSGVTLVLWNRRELSQIQSQRHKPGPQEASADLEEDFF